MGCWNGTCAVSNLHVKAGEDVAVFLLLKNARENSFCYGNALYDVCPIPFYGKYDDYGGVENCHGDGLPIVLDALKQQLYEFGQGPNEYHDCEVRRDNLTIEKLFEADHEGRLAVEQGNVWDEDSYDLNELEKIRGKGGLTVSQQFEMDRLANKIKGVDTFRRVTHVIIHGKVFNAIMNDWFIEDYVGNGKGNKGYNNNYIHLHFKDLKDSIPEYMRRIRESASTKMATLEKLHVAGAELTKEEQDRLYKILMTSTFEWNDPCLAGKWIRSMRESSDGVWGLIDVDNYVKEYVAQERWEELEKFVTEALTAAWINCFMSFTRKIWTKQSGSGSQSQEHSGYIVLADTVKNILEEERKEYEEDEE